MSSFRFNNDFRLPDTAAILYDSWSILAALSWGYAERFFGTTFRPKLGSRLQAGGETLAVILALGWVLIN